MNTFKRSCFHILNCLSYFKFEVMKQFPCFIAFLHFYFWRTSLAQSVKILFHRWWCHFLWWDISHFFRFTLHCLGIFCLLHWCFLGRFFGWLVTDRLEVLINDWRGLVTSLGTRIFALCLRRVTLRCRWIIFTNTVQLF